MDERELVLRELLHDMDLLLANYDVAHSPYREGYIDGMGVVANVIRNYLNNHREKLRCQALTKE